MAYSDLIPRGDVLELPEIKALVEAAFCEGYIMGNVGAWDCSSRAWEYSDAHAALTTQSAAPMKCAECDCDNPPHGCNWIKAGPSLPRYLAVRMGATDGTHGEVVIHNLANSEELAGFDLVSFELADVPAVIAALAALQTKGGV